MIVFPKIEPYPSRIYIMQSRDLLMKVGSSNVAEARRNEVSWTNGGGVLLLWETTQRVRYPTTIERRVFQILRHFHVRGEWYRCSVFEAKRAIEEAVRDVADALASFALTDEDASANVHRKARKPRS